MKKIKY